MQDLRYRPAPKKKDWFKRWEAQDFSRQIYLMKEVLTIACTRDVNRVHQEMQRLYYDGPIMKRMPKRKYDYATKRMLQEWYDTTS